MKYLIIISILLTQSCTQLHSQKQEEKTPMTHPAENQWLIEDLIKKWENNKQYSIEVLTAMPEEFYDFSPAKGMKSFREQASHIATGFNFQLKKSGLPSLPAVKNKSKASMIASYTEIFDALIQNLKNYPAAELGEEASMWYGSSTKLRMLNLMDNHLAHHRGQMIVYLRLKGIKAPSYIGW
ncbi:MAG: DinB family protein [Bacteroidia bacterium]|nr:DinB family protein [Bacteroidia bacterium]